MLLGSDGRVQRLLSYEEFLDSIRIQFERRNSLSFTWADGTKDPLNPSEE